MAIGRNKTFPIYNADGSSFHGIVLHKATYDSSVMSLGDKITGEAYFNGSLAVTMQEYIEWQFADSDDVVRFVLVNPPTIVREGLVKDNSDLKGMTKYSFEFYHPMYILGNLPFSDVAVSNDEKKYLSQNKTFSWIGKTQDYINKINKNLEGTEWIVVKSSRFPQEKDDELSDVLTFDNNTIADALKTGYETWGLPYVVSQINQGEPYYSQGKRFKVEFGLPSNEILVDNEPYIFQFGQGVGLKNNSRTPRNNKIITRIAGYGSEQNIPYGYPQIRWYGDPSATETPAGYPVYDGIVGGVVRKLIKHPFTRTHLMPSIYTQTVFNKVSPYLANGSANPDYNPDEEIIDYYDAVYSQEYPYVNEINLLAPSYEIHEFADIKPELDSDRQLGIVSAIPLNQDLTPASQWDDTYDAEKDEYVQSYFKITLPQLSFDLYACASIMEEMQVNMRSGACLGCTFPIQVDWEDYKRNFYDADGNFLPDGSQRDLTKYPKSNLGQISVVVQKENSTFGTLMPNIYQQPKANDLFVFIGISLPLSYITDAEERLDDAMKSYMLENNVYYYDYPLKFDEYFLATHTNILEQIRPNSIVHFEYGGVEQKLFVKQITIHYGNATLPQYNISLTDNIEIVLNQIGQVANDVEKLSSLLSILRQTYSRNVWNELAKKLSKTQDDTAQGFIRFLQGLQIGSQFTPDILGEGGVFRKEEDGRVNLVTDNLYVRVKAYFDTIEIRRFLHTGGNRIASLAGMKCCRVEWLSSTETVLEQTNSNRASVKKFRCYFRAADGDDEVRNDFQIGDQAYCHVTSVATESDNPETKGLNQKHYWRLVTGRNIDGVLTENGEAYIDLSNSDTEDIGGVSYAGFQSDSDFPNNQDDIIQLGNVNDSTRRGAIIEYVSGTDAPSYQIYQSLGTPAESGSTTEEKRASQFSLSNKNYLGLGYNSATDTAYLKVYGNAYIGSRDVENGGYISYNQQDRLMELKGRMNIGSTLADGRNINALGTSNGNILLNTSFTGDYDSEDVNSNTDVTPNTIIYSDPLKHWQGDGVTIVESSESQSGYAAKLASGGSLTQNVSLDEGKWYVLSFRGNGGTLTYSVGGVSGTIELKPTTDYYDIPFICVSSSPLTLSASSETTVMELNLCEGSLPTAWEKNYQDGEKTMAEVNVYKYIANAIREASTEIIGGLILSQMLKVGNYRDKSMVQETGGMSGLYTSENSPFLWGGGTMSQALYTIMKYANDPSYQASEEEISNMTNFVVTHGGRAILNDVILRGYIYALGGYFHGELVSASGTFTGSVFSNDNNVVLTKSENAFGLGYTWAGFAATSNGIESGDLATIGVRINDNGYDYGRIALVKRETGTSTEIDDDTSIFMSAEDGSIVASAYRIRKAYSWGSGDLTLEDNADNRKIQMLIYTAEDADSTVTLKTKPAGGTTMIIKRQKNDGWLNIRNENGELIGALSQAATLLCVYDDNQQKWI